ncbi:bifunctional (p)ppGpp synthetase/guanosine-3',5'-bis(diphosphate) 3'-pyrophosphohydrolase [Chitinivorax sp. B]|uniref:bifunctional (p)ppGpp synthetase/guanosine-3',5'-bis(diphosphate) 3'-pyrophosphohydrolase n=1 Tax=Chitinivorax sp. B TaxID=2502235 RepID=UPI0032D572C4
MWAVSGTQDADANPAIQYALLHDTLESAQTTFGQLTVESGEAVACGVQALSKNPSLPTKAEQMNDSLTRILQQPTEIAMVKMADRITNLYHPPFYWDKAKIAAYQLEARYIHDRLHHANPILTTRLADHVVRYRQLCKTA